MRPDVESILVIFLDHLPLQSCLGRPTGSPINTAEEMLSGQSHSMRMNRKGPMSFPITHDGANAA
jgi:hypothetical protein